MRTSGTFIRSHLELRFDTLSDAGTTECHNLGEISYFWIGENTAIAGW